MLYISVLSFYVPALETQFESYVSLYTYIYHHKFDAVIMLVLVYRQ